MSQPKAPTHDSAVLAKALLTAQNDATKIIVTDRDVIVHGHAKNKAACIAVSAAVQTFAYVAGMLKLLDRAPDMDAEAPRYHVHLEDSLEARRAIVGLMSAFAGIAKSCPDALLFSDNRRALDAAESLMAEGPLPAEDRSNGGFAEAIEPGIRATSERLIQIPKLFR